MSAAHTAGPWKVARFGGVPAYYSVYEPGAYSVADFCSDVPGIDNGANARLCAAAPALLDALRSLLLVVECAVENLPAYETQINRARAAIAAAEWGAS